MLDKTLLRLTAVIPPVQGVESPFHFKSVVHRFFTACYGFYLFFSLSSDSWFSLSFFARLFDGVFDPFEIYFLLLLQGCHKLDCSGGIPFGFSFAQSCPPYRSSHLRWVSWVLRPPLALPCRWFWDFFTMEF